MCFAFPPFFVLPFLDDNRFLSRRTNSFPPKKFADAPLVGLVRDMRAYS